MCSHAATSFAGVEVGGIDLGSHALGLIYNAIVWVGGNIIKELVDGQTGGFSSSCLFDGNRAESNQELVIQSSSIKEKGTNSALDMFDPGIVERRTGVCFGRILDLGVVCDFGVLVRRALAFLGMRMIVTIEDGLDVAWNGETTGTFDVISIEGDDSKCGASPPQ